MKRFTEIKGLTEQTRLPRLGIIRLGLKIEKAGKTFPTETDYFVVPPEVTEVYGRTPKELDILIPLNDRRLIFPQSYRFYGSGKGLKCQGDGETACFIDDKEEIKQRQCPCVQWKNEKCKQVGTLFFLLPKVSIAGVYQLSTSSVTSIIDINSGLKYTLALVGRFAFIPMKLKRVKTIIHYQGKAGTHYTLQLAPDVSIQQVTDLRADNTRMIEFSSKYEVPVPEDQEVDTPPDYSNGGAGETAGPATETEAPPIETKEAVTETASPAKELGEGPQDWETKITDDHFNEIISLSSRHKVDNLDELLATRGLPPFNQDFPDILFEDLQVIIQEASERLPFDLVQRQGQESYLEMDQLRVIDKMRSEAGIDSATFARHLIDLVGSNSLAKIKIKHVKEILKWFKEHKGTPAPTT